MGVLGLEPRSLAAQDFESSVFTNFTILPPPPERSCPFYITQSLEKAMENSAKCWVKLRQRKYLSKILAVAHFLPI